jgi:P pilus assembly chaperone PapD
MPPINLTGSIYIKCLFVLPVIKWLKLNPYHYFVLMMNITQWTKGLFAAISLQLFSTLPASAQDFTLSPLVTISTTKSGQSKGSLNVTNNAKEPLRMRVFAESFAYDRRQGYIPTPKDDHSAVPYLNFSPRELVIPPGVTRNIRVAVTLPLSLPNQEYRAAILVEELKARDIQAINKPANSQKISFRLRIGAVFFFSKGSDNIANIQARTAMLNLTDKKVALVLENTGKQTARPEVSWRIEKNGQAVAKDVINGVIIQAENSREVILQTNGKSPDLARGEYRIVGDIINNGQKPIAFSLPLIVP